MGLIVAVAYLKMCPCGKHGKIVFADGSKTPEFFSKESARSELNKIGCENKLSTIEYTFLKDQISSSHRLSEYDESADLDAMMASEIMNAREEYGHAEEKTKYVM